MPVIYEVIFHYDGQKDELSVTRIPPDGSQDTGPVNSEDIHWVGRTCQDSRWNERAHLCE